MKISIIIVNYNVRYFLEQCLYSLEIAINLVNKHYGKESAEVIVIDNASTDDSKDVIPNKFSSIKYIYNKQNLGFSIANNQGIRIAKGEFILLLNPDTVLKEDSLVRPLLYLDKNQNVGGLGIKMIDGHGNFLPESKRGLPTPWVSFCKISGLAKVFPKSKKFGKYHLKYLDESKNHEVEVLAGAYMLLRKSVLEKVGLFDETFFMYGEDIDLSYRIILGGYKNVYFSETYIIHYKGESTKKNSLNYVKVFFKAMIIFAKKHFTNSNGKWLVNALAIAVWFQATFLMLKNLLKAIFIPILDFTLMIFILNLFVNYWANTIKYISEDYYPPILYSTFIPIYCSFFILGLFLNGAYSKPHQLNKILKGVIVGALMVFTFYAFVDAEYRFSRAILLATAIIALFVASINRFFYNLFNKSERKFSKGHQILFVGDVIDYQRFKTAINEFQIKFKILGRIALTNNEQESVATIHQIEETTKILKANEIVFSEKTLGFSKIIDLINEYNKLNLDFKIFQSKGDFIIGSSNKNTKGDYYSFKETLNIDKKSTKTLRVFFNGFLAFILLIVSPITVWLFRNKRNFYKNLFNVIKGKVFLVGRDFNEDRKCLITPSNIYTNETFAIELIQKLNHYYAKNYSIQSDIELLLKGFNILDK